VRFRSSIWFGVSTLLFIVGCSSSETKTVAVWRAEQEPTPPKDQNDSITLNFPTVKLGPNGRVYAFDRGPRLITSCDSAGLHCTRIGRFGKGPGEYDQVSAFGFIGDTLWVSEAFPRRFTYFSLDGKLIRVFSQPKNPAGFSQALDITGFLSDGSAIFSSSLPSKQRGVAGESHIAFRVAPMAEDKPLSFIGEPDTLPGSHTMIPIQLSAEAIQFSAYPWPMRDMLALAPDGSRAVVVHQQPGRGYSVRAFSSRDTLYRVDVATTSVPVTSEMRERWIKSQTGVILKDLSMSEGQKHDVLQKALGEVAEIPAASDLVVAKDGSAWIRREGMIQFQAQPGDSVQWDVIDPSGKRSGTLKLPAQLTVFAIEGDRVWGVQPSRDDLLEIVKYRIHRSSGGSNP
jgi:hypothetical protein